MKKIAPIVALAVIAAFASCKKDYTCTCKNSAGAVEATYKFTKVKKKDAKSACDTWNTAFAVTGGSCSL